MRETIRRALSLSSAGNVAGRMMGAGGVKAILVCFHVVLREFPLVNIRDAEFPVFVRLIDAGEESRR